MHFNPFSPLPSQLLISVTGRFLFLLALSGLTGGPPRAFIRRHTSFHVTPIPACRRWKGERRLHVRGDTRSGESQERGMAECSPFRLRAIWRHVVQFSPGKLFFFPFPHKKVVRYTLLKNLDLPALLLLFLVDVLEAATCRHDGAPISCASDTPEEAIGCRGAAAVLPACGIATRVHVSIRS